MKITVDVKEDKKQDVLVVGKWEGDSIKGEDFSGKWGEKFVSSNDEFSKVLYLGLGKESEFTLERVRRVLGKAVSYTKCVKKKGFTTSLLKGLKFDPKFLGRAAAEGIILGNYSFDKYLAKDKKKKSLVSVSLVYSGKGLNSGLKEGIIIAESTNFVRDLVNEPANVVNSLFLEKAAKKVVGLSSKLTLRVLNEPQLKKLGMGALLGVNKGSVNPPKLVFVEYKGGKGKWTALCGKGITFDSGGYNLKPTKYIETMKTDMGGAGAVLGALKAAALLGVKKNIVGVMAVCENMVSSSAQRPGDIVKAYNGKTIEIGNTDAEGRLVLADALAYTEERYKPAVMIDLATLTGAVVVSLGYYASGLMGRDDSLQSELLEAGFASGDRAWKLPFFEDYQDWMDGSISDLNNIGQKGAGWEAGSITAGVFLSKFVKMGGWAHLDIAGTARLKVENEYMKKGCSGSGVRLLSYYFLGA